jgi:hypothetical protein
LAPLTEAGFPYGSSAPTMTVKSCDWVGKDGVLSNANAVAVLAST